MSYQTCVKGTIFRSQIWTTVKVFKEKPRYVTSSQQCLTCYTFFLPLITLTIANASFLLAWAQVNRKGEQKMFKDDASIRMVFTELSVVKPEPKWSLRPNTRAANSSVNQSKFKVVSCKRRQAPEDVRMQLAIGFGFASHWLKVVLSTSHRAKAKPKQTLRSTE